MNRKTITRLGLYLLMTCLGTAQVWAQGSEEYGSGLKLNLNDDGSKYVRFIIWNQIWARYTDNNPGTIVNNEAQTNTTDVALRRSRMLAFSQISPRFLVMFHWGINNQTFINGGTPGGTAGFGANGPGKKPQLFVHDAWAEYAVVKSKLHIGAGLHYWNGISRMTSSSTLNYLTIDAPIFNWATIEASDQFARQFGIYAKGQLGKIQYQVALNKPFSASNIASSMEQMALPTQPQAPAGTAAVDASNNSWASLGYITYNFFDTESSLLPFRVGSYLGTKKVLNIGAGWHYHPDATANSVRNPAGDLINIQRNDMTLLGADVFVDLPLNRTAGTALTAYSVFYNYDFGPNYLRNIGILNVAQSGGNFQPTIGTGQIWYTQAGFLLPKSILGDKGRLQPFAAFTYKNFDALQDASSQYDVGMNYYISGHHAKITLQYSTRPVYGADGRFHPTKPSAGELITQFMIYL
jgi:hypothetical protein